jgi:hypothetical protein
MKWSDDDLDLALRDLRDEEIPVGAVRARVMAQVARRRSVRWWMWAWVPALAAALFVMTPKESPVAPPPLLARAPGPPVLAAPVAVVKRPAVVEAAVKATVKAVADAPARTGETEFVKVMTDDPDVVILWAMNTEGDR